RTGGGAPDGARVHRPPSVVAMARPYLPAPSIILPYFIITSPIAFIISPRICIIRGESDWPPVIPMPPPITAPPIMPPSIGHIPPSMSSAPAAVAKLPTLAGSGTAGVGAAGAGATTRWGFDATGSNTVMLESPKGIVFHTLDGSHGMTCGPAAIVWGICWPGAG